jgi:CRISPR/Cas system-associated exonuclease Cas4 (RecB family)
MCYTLDMPPIRSSDIGSYLYCRRAWWYRRQGYEPANQAELVYGTELHRRHGRKVLLASFLRALGMLLLLVSLVLLVIHFVSGWGG